MNQLSIVEQGSHKYVECGRFPFSMRDKSSLTLPYHHREKNCAISVAICSLYCLFFISALTIQPIHSNGLCVNLNRYFKDSKDKCKLKKAWLTFMRGPALQV